MKIAAAKRSLVCLHPSFSCTYCHYCNIDMMGKLKLQTSIPRLSYLVCLEGTLGVHSSAIGIHRKIRIKERNGQDCEQGSPFRWARKGQAGLCRYGGCLAGKGSEGTRFYQNGGCPGPQDPGKGCSWCSGHFPRHFRGRQMKNLNKRSPPSPLLLSLPAPAFRTVAGGPGCAGEVHQKKALVHPEKTIYPMDP